MAIGTPVHDATVTMLPHAETHVPPAPRSVEETGLAFLSLVELLTKILFLRGQLRLVELSAHIKLPASILEKLLGFMRTERLCEVVRRGGTDGEQPIDPAQETTANETPAPACKLLLRRRVGGYRDRIRADRRTDCGRYRRCREQRGFSPECPVHQRCQLLPLGSMLRPIAVMSRRGHSTA